MIMILEFVATTQVQVEVGGELFMIFIMLSQAVLKRHDHEFGGNQDAWCGIVVKHNLDDEVLTSDLAQARLDTRCKFKYA